MWGGGGEFAWGFQLVPLQLSGVGETLRVCGWMGVQENGKNRTEAVASIAKGNETVEWATSLPQLISGRIQEVWGWEWVGVRCVCRHSPPIHPLLFPAPPPQHGPRRVHQARLGSIHAHTRTCALGRGSTQPQPGIAFVCVRVRVQVQVSRGITCQDSREPIGVVASICPFNFPVMVPCWTVPIALTTGNW